MIKHNRNRFLPLLVSLGVCLGILLGSFFANHFSGNRLSIINNSSNKVVDLFHLIDDQYVDSVNTSSRKAAHSHPWTFTASSCTANPPCRPCSGEMGCHR